MREIKFRAWDNNLNQMYEIVSINFDLQFIHLDPDYCHKVKIKDIELMQYTGLKDKNGVEIYEGDMVEWSDGKLLSEVYWDQADVAFSLRCNGESWFLNDDSMLCGMEVVGNIYENHELVDK